MAIVMGDVGVVSTAGAIGVVMVIAMNDVGVVSVVGALSSLS